MEPAESRTGFVIGACALYGLILVSAEGAAAWWPDQAGYSWSGNQSPALVLGLGLGVGFVVSAASVCFAVRTSAGRRLTLLMGEVLRGLRWWGVLALSLSAGLAEEALFRGTLWSLMGSCWDQWAALVGTSVLFGAAHGLFRGRFATWSVFALITGFLLGGLRMVSGGLLAPALAHAFINVVNIPVVIRLSGRGRP